MKGLYVDRCPPVPFKGGEASVAIKKERLTKLSILREPLNALLIVSMQIGQNVRSLRNSNAL